jgi:16S rRNA processing protein RimM
MNNNYVIIGKIGTPYGINGWVKILIYSENIDNIFDLNPWYIEEKDAWSLIELETSRPHGKGIVAKVGGINTPEQARRLTGKKIAVSRSQLPELKANEYYWHDLIGLTVINQRGELLGKISSILETGSNDVLIVKGIKEHAIPYLPGQVIVRVDLAKKEIQVDWELIE